MSAPERAATRTPRQRALAGVGPLKDWLERSKDHGDLLPYSVEYRQEIPVSPDAYNSGEVGFEVHIRIWSERLHKHSEYYIARVYRAANVLAHHRRHLPVMGARFGTAVGELIPVGCLQRHLVGGDNGHDEDSMFVGVGQVSERPEYVEVGGNDCEWLPSLGWLHLFSDLGSPVSDPSGVGATFKASPGSADWELNASRFLFGRFSTEVFDREFPPCEIECSAEVLDRVADEQRQLVRQLRDALHLPGDLPLLSVVLAPEGDRVSVAFGVGCDGGADRIYVGLRPFYIKEAKFRRRRNRQKRRSN